MASEGKRKYVKVVGPKGVAVFPHLGAPDFKFKKEVGEFHTKVRVKASQTEALVEALTKARDEVVEQAIEKVTKEMADLKGKALAAAKKQLEGLRSGELVNDLPITPVYDDDGNETDEVEISYKRAGSFKDRKTGESKKVTIPLVDAKGNLIKKKISVWGGSRIEVAASILPYITPLGVGVRLSLDGVRIISLVSGGERDGASLGFKVDDEDAEDGFSADDIPDEDEAKPVESDGEETSDDDDDPDF